MNPVFTVAHFLNSYSCLYFLPSVSKPSLLWVIAERTVTNRRLPVFEICRLNHIYFSFCAQLSQFQQFLINLCTQFKNYIKILLFVSELRHTEDQPPLISQHMFYLCTSGYDCTKCIAEKEERRKHTQYPSAMRIPLQSAITLLLSVRPADAI